MQLRSLIRTVENKYNQLFVTLILLYIFSPFFIDTKLGSPIAFFIFLISITLTIYRLKHRKNLYLYLGLSLTALILRTSIEFIPVSVEVDILFLILSSSIFLAFLSLSVYLILGELFVSEKVTGDTIKGGICVYFLIGFFWASLYIALYRIDPYAFTAVSPKEIQADLTYFSFTTLTTTGYGDVAPVSAIARVLANLEGIAGIMYPAILIARLVGIYSKD